MKEIIISFVLAVGIVDIFASAADPQKSKRIPAPQTLHDSTEHAKVTRVPLDTNNTLTPLLKLGFEKEHIIPSATLRSNYDKLHATLASGEEGDIPIQYEGGTIGDRYARIISDPMKSGNHILHYWLKKATIPTGFKGGYAYKGRIQLNLSGLGYTSAFARYRMYLHPDLNFYRSYPNENVWFTVSELWFRHIDGNNFRIPVNIAKEKGTNKPLYFVASGDVGKSDNRGKDGRWKSIWGKVNNAFEIPVGEWIDMEIGYKQGDKNSGRFYLAAKRPSDVTPVTIFDITDWTYNPDASTPTSLTQWNPLKLYTSGKIIKYIHDQGGVAQIYWDDFEIFDTWPQ